MKDYGVFCKLKNCEEFIAWDCKFDSEAQPYPCESCKRVGQSYSVTEYPKDCNFLDEIQYIKSVFGWLICYLKVWVMHKSINQKNE